MLIPRAGYSIGECGSECGFEVGPYDIFISPDWVVRPGNFFSYLVDLILAPCVN